MNSNTKFNQMELPDHNFKAILIKVFQHSFALSLESNEKKKIEILSKDTEVIKKKEQKLQIQKYKAKIKISWDFYQSKIKQDKIQ